MYFTDGERGDKKTRDSLGTILPRGRTQQAKYGTKRNIAEDVEVENQGILASRTSGP